MIVITDVKYFEVSESVYHIVHPVPSMLIPGDGFPLLHGFSDEVIRGEEYVTGNGERIFIGLDGKLRELLGIPLDALFILRRENEDLKSKWLESRRECEEWKKVISDYMKLPFWKRLFLKFRWSVER